MLETELVIRVVLNPSSGSSGRWQGFFFRCDGLQLPPKVKCLLDGLVTCQSFCS
jgi:hypothetical protein